MQQTYIDMED